MATPQFDPATFAKNATEAVRQAQTQWEKQADKAQATAVAVGGMLKAMGQVGQSLSENPHDLMQRTLAFYQSQMALGANMLEQMMGRQPAPVATPDKDDRRFNAEAWNNPVSDLLKQSYLLASRYLTETVNSAKGLDPHTHAQAKFFTRQITEMASPGNSPLTNPEVLATALATGGQSLIDGFGNMMADAQAGRISMTDYKAFTVGRNIAATKGDVVFRNRMVEVIQYAPQTEKVHAIPLIICPPWINRFYILELQAHNSLVNYLVQQGFQVFMVSWKNPDASYRDTTFDDYLTEGFMGAVNAVKDITGQSSVNTMGYCIGGAMLACATALLNSKKDTSVNTAAFLCTLTDYADTGEVSVFVDEEQVAALEAKMQKEGVMDGRDMAGTFASLRASDLIWSYVINNYMLGKSPAPFDILYWNDDSTRMPCAMHSWYLRNFYLENNIAVKDKLTLMGTKLDITNLTQPLYMLAGQTDHITPWLSTYKPFAKMKSASKRFILSKSGHVAGVVNPPTAPGKPIKKSLMAGDATASNGTDWLKTATEVPDSWWPDYTAWLKPHAGELVAAPKSAGSKSYKALEPAPGQYVKEH